MSEPDSSRMPPNDGGAAEHPTFRPDLVTKNELTGHRVGDRVVRVSRHRNFWGSGSGALVLRPAATEPRSGASRAWWRAKRFLIGQPIPTAEEGNERLTRIKALAVLSPDALSSVAYGGEAAMRVLLLAGVGALGLILPISLAIALLLLIVATSYQQTIEAYPSGGGSYIVALENLGIIPGLVAGAALIVSYILTVAVSIAAGAEAIVSAFPNLQQYHMALIIGAVVVMTVVNLRGVREAGSVFVVPTYVFVLTILGLIAFGVFRLYTDGIPYVPGDPGPEAGTEPLTWFLILSAFSKGCSAMTGTEAIANAVPAFKAPESRNARITLGWMAGLLAIMFIGISFLATQIGLVPAPEGSETVLSQLTRLIVGDSWYYYLVQFSTAIILTVAANTCFAGFPWLLKIMARDRYVPSWFGLRGDRLVFSTGMITLAAASVVLLVAFQGSVDRLLPLYAIGVFTAFTLSQSGMVMHWLRGRESARGRKVAVNGIGAATTAMVTLIIAVTKFGEGAWLVMVVVPIIIAACMLVHQHYLAAAQQLNARTLVGRKGRPPLVLLPVGSLNLVTRQALAFCQDLSQRVVAVHVASEAEEAEALRKEWQQAAPDVPLVVIESPYRMLVPPLLAYVDALGESYPDDYLLVVLPEFVPKRWWENVLHNQTALRLKAALLFRPGVVVANYPFQLSS